MSETPPSRSERQRCWDGRDAYFGCLTANNLIQDDPKSLCKKEKGNYEKECAASWVSLLPSFCQIDLTNWSKVEYFNKRRILEMRQKFTVCFDLKMHSRLIEGNSNSKLTTHHCLECKLKPHFLQQRHQRHLNLNDLYDIALQEIDRNTGL